MSETIVHIRGVVIPTWLAACLLVTAILAALSLLLTWQNQMRIERELRILQLHCSDIENVLIRQGVASRADFVSQPQQPEKGKKP